MKNKKVEIDWFEQRTALEKRWLKWRGRFSVKGVGLVARIPEQDISGGGENFYLEFEDKFGGVLGFKVLNLGKFDENSMVKLAQGFLRRLPVGICPRCQKSALLANNKRSRYCRKCLILKLEEDAKLIERKITADLKKRMVALRKNGFKYLAQIWIHSKKEKDDSLIEVPFRLKPTSVEIKKIARKHKSAIVDDFRVIKL